MTRAVTASWITLYGRGEAEMSRRSDPQIEAITCTRPSSPSARGEQPLSLLSLWLHKQWLPNSGGKCLETTGVAATGKPLAGVDLSLARLTDVAFDRGDLSFARLNGALLRRVRARGAGFENATLTGSTLVGTWRRPINIAAIVASAGGLPAVTELLSLLPSDLCETSAWSFIEAIGRSRTGLVCSKTGRTCGWTNPLDGDRVANGVVYVAPSDQHMRWEWIRQARPQHEGALHASGRRSILHVGGSSISTADDRYRADRQWR